MLKVPKIKQPISRDISEPSSDESNSFLPDQGQPQFVPPDEPLDLPDKTPNLEEMYNQASQENPNKAAQIVELSRKLDSPASFISDNVDNLKKIEARPSTSFFKELESQYPGTTKFLNAPGNMAASHDDLDNLANHERVVRQAVTTHGILGALNAGFQQSVPGIVATEGQPLTTVGENPSIMDSLASQAGALVGDIAPMTAGSLIGGLSGSGVGAAVGTALLPGLGTMAGAYVGGMVGGAAGGFALPAAMKSALLSYYNEGKIKSFDDLITRVSDIANSGAKQGVVGAITGGAGAVASKFGGLAQRGAEALAMATGGKAIEGELPTTRDLIDSILVVEGLHQATAGAGLIRKTLIERRQIQEAKNFYTALGDTAEASEVRKRLPESHQQLISDITKDTPVENVYIPVKAMDEYFQSKNLDAQKVAEKIGVADSYNEARQTGGDVKIPLADWVKNVVGTEHYNNLANDIRFDQNSLTVNEYHQKLSEIEQETKKAQESAVDQQGQEVAQAEKTKIEENILNQLLNAGIPMNEAKRYSQVYGSAFHALGQRLGIPSEELFGRYGLEINNGSGDGGQTYNQDAVNKPAFYSKLQRTIEEKMPNSATPEQINGILKDVKAEERQYSGIDEFLAGKDKVSKEELLNHLKENQIQINETRLAEDSGVSVGDTVYGVYSSDGEGIASFKDKDAARKYVRDLVLEEGSKLNHNDFSIQEEEFNGQTLEDYSGPVSESSAGPTQFSKYTLPGGENYREVLFTLPNRNPGESYHSSHFNEPNILAHVRLNDRVDANGNKVLFMEEVQSDWHQAGRNRGYQRSGEELPPGFTYKFDESKKIKEFQHQVIDPEGKIAGMGPTKEAAIADFNRVSVKQAKVPDAPFKKTWHEMALKRVIKEAVEKGYDKIAWTTGEQQAERYDLSKQIETVQYKAGDGIYELRVTDKNGEEVISDKYDKSELPGVIGKELADKIISGQGKKYRGRDFKELSGLDLKVGGEGMKGFYDKIIPEFLNKYGKRFGAKVEDTTLPNLSFDQVMQNGGKQPGQQTVHSLPITEAMRESVLKEGQTLFQGDENTPRGSIRIKAEGSDKSISISLLEGKDKSTFLHETGHFFLEVLGDVANSDKATPQIKEDYQKVLDWMGVKDRSEIATEHHEKWARAMEQYFAEGNAPSPELRGAFSRFKDWILSIYKDLKNLNVNLTDDVRGVMDRLLATDEAIQKAKESIGYSETEIKEVSPSDAQRLEAIQAEARQKAEYEVFKGQIKETTAEHKEFLKEERAKAKEASTEEVKNLPIFQAQEYLKEGLRTRKPLDEIANKFLEGKLKPDDIALFESAAELHGFGGGEELAKEIIVSSKNKLFDLEVEKRTDEKMSVYTNKMDYPALLIEQAVESMHSSKMAEVLATEGLILRKLVLKDQGFKKEIQETNAAMAKADAEIAKLKAAKILSEKTAKDATNFRAYITAERRSAEKVTRALKYGDYEAAATAKREQMLNHALAAEAFRNRTESAKILKYLNEAGKRGRDLMKAPYAFVRQVDTLLGSAGIAPNRKEDVGTFIEIAKKMFANGESPSEIANATGLKQDGVGGWEPETLQDFVSRVNDNYYSMSAPDSVNRLGDKNYKLMKMGELRDLHSAVKNILEIGKGYNKWLSQDRKDTIVEAAKAFRDSVESLVGTKYAERRQIGSKAERTKITKAVEYIKEFPDTVAPSMVNLLTLTNYLDGFQSVGPAKDNIYRVLKAAEDAKLARYERMTKEVNDLFEKFYTPKEMKSYKETGSMVPEFGRYLSKEEILSLALNWGNEGNRQRVRDGYQLNDAQIQKVLGRLEKRDWDFVQGVWDHLNTYWPEIVALEMKVRGVEPKAVEAKPVQTAFGEYAGGYYPIAYDFEKSTDAYRNEEQKNALYKTYSASFAHTDTGHTQSRVSYVGRPVRLSLDVLMNHLENVVHDLEYRPAVIDVARFIRQGDVKTAIENSIGIQGYKAIESSLKAVASDQSEYMSFADKAFRWFRFKSTFATLAYRLFTFPMDLTGNSINAVWEIGPTRFASAMKDFVMSPKDTKEFIEEKSARMQYRATLRDRDIMEISKKWSGKDSAVKQYGYIVQALADEAISYPLWMEVYKKNVAELGEKKAIDLADETVTRTVGSGTKLDQVGAQRGSQSSKILTMYYSWMSMMFNRMWSSGKMAELQYNQGNVGSAISVMAKATLFGWVLQGAQESFWRELFRNNQEDNEEERNKRVLGRMLQQPFGYIWIVRDIAGYGIDKAIGQKGTNYRLSPMEQAVESIVDPFARAANIAFSDNKEFDEKFGESAARSAAYMLGYPQQLNNLAFNFMDWMQDNGELTWRDLLTRRTKK